MWLCVDRRVLQVAAVEARGVTASTVASSTATDSPGAAPESDEDWRDPARQVRESRRVPVEILQRLQQATRDETRHCGVLTGVDARCDKLPKVVNQVSIYRKHLWQRHCQQTAMRLDMQSRDETSADTELRSTNYWSS